MLQKQPSTKVPSGIHSAFPDSPITVGPSSVPARDSSASMFPARGSISTVMHLVTCARFMPTAQAHVCPFPPSIKVKSSRKRAAEAIDRYDGRPRNRQPALHAAGGHVHRGDIQPAAMWNASGTGFITGTTG